MGKFGNRYVCRFGLLPRLIHLAVVISFLALTATGMTLKYATRPWAKTVADMAGSFSFISGVHCFFAVIVFICLILNFVLIFHNWKKSGKSVNDFLFDPDHSLIPMANDGKELVQTFMWFLGKDRLPQYGRWIYWEKFDYMAVFWGAAVIATTGLCLWFPEQFTAVIPGYWINIAAIIHSDEALLLTGFILIIHFFNTHLRPEKFPMDPVIFTGVVSVEKLKRERPREYQTMMSLGKFPEALCEPPSPEMVIAAHIFGISALIVGIVLVIAIFLN